MSPTQIQNPKSKIEWAALALILLVAAFLRLYRLDAVPPGLTHDEADTGYFAAAVYRGAPSQVQAPYGYINEPFTQYSGALFMRLLGPNDFALRVHSAFWGMVLLIFAYLWVRRAFGPLAALGAAAMIAGSFWTVSTSRFALNPEPAPALFTASAYFLWCAIDETRQRAWRAWGALTGCLAGSLYAYEVARASAAVLAAFAVYMLLVGRSHLRRHVASLIVALALAGLLAAPHLLDPHAWQRSTTLAEPLRAAQAGDVTPLIKNAANTLGTVNLRGDSFVTYNLPGRPILDPAASVFFAIGLALCLWRWRNPACTFVLMWTAAGLAPSLVTGEWTSTLHSMAGQTPLLALPALGAVEVGRWIKMRFGPRWVTAFGAACALWLVVIAASTGHDYFVRWGQARETRAAYFANLAAITDYLNRTPHSGAVALSSPFPDLPLDPFIAEMRLRRRDLALRWFTAPRALVFPNSAKSLLIVPPNSPLDPGLAGRLDLRRIERIHLRPDDVDPYFDVYEWNPQTALARFKSSQPVTAGNQSRTLPVNLGAVELVGYELPVQPIKPGGTLALLTAWRVLDPAALGPLPATDYGRAAVVFAHLLDDKNAVIGQEDRLDAPAWNWQAGDGLLQVLQFPIPPTAQPGAYQLEIGAYNRHDLKRLPVLADGGGRVDDRMLVAVRIGEP